MVPRNFIILSTYSVSPPNLVWKYFPTWSNEQISVISIPSNLFGEYLKPGSVTLSYFSSFLGQFNFYDDGLGNLLTSSLKVGDIIYEHGMIILTSGGVTGSANGYG